MARRKGMEMLILKIVACVCVTIVAGLMVRNNEEEAAFWLELIALAIIFIPWDKIIELILIPI